MQGIQSLMEEQQPAPLSNFNFVNSISDFHGSSSLGNPVMSEVKRGLSLSPLPLPGTEELVRVPVRSSKYFKAAQELLHQVVYIGKQANTSAQSAKITEDVPTKRGDDLTTADKQEFHIKLINMLHQVEQRYKQYEHEMQMVISWWEQAAGEGSAETYTALALQTISKQFRCLKDAILAQILVATTNLGQQEHKIQGRRLKYIDNKIRRMMIHRRPQRGLPHRSVSILRAWLFDHFLHPYPKDTDKILLANQTGLTRSQVSNWFINARVRLWKPMMEEMYAQEVEGQTSDDDISQKSKHAKAKMAEAETGNKCTQDNNDKTSSTAPDEANFRSNVGLKKPQNAEVSESPSVDVAMNLFASYSIVQTPYSSNGVSLTLGLQHFPNQTMHLILPPLLNP